MGHSRIVLLLLFISVISGYADVPIKPTVILSPDWPLVYRGESVTLRCEIHASGGSEWTYEWRPSRLNKLYTTRQSIYVTLFNKSYSGEYSCRGVSAHSSTDWSDAITLTVYKLSVSISWVNPGDSVTLRCEVEHPPTGTKFFWYKAVPKISDPFYTYELLPGSSNGTDDNFYIVHGQNNTTGYVCEAGRREIKYRDPTFVWSADPHPTVSLSVSPDRVQHFRSDSVSLSCEGNSTKWRVRRITETGHVLECSVWGIMNGSSCTMKGIFSYDGVYWCESESGEFSNAVNITVQNFHYDNPILVSPVHPVTEGDPVTLSCRDKEQKLLSNVFFYHNNKLIHNDSREELNISAVSKSDEGFYKCEHSGKESPQSWMAVRANVSTPVSSFFHMLLITGSVIGPVILLIILLLLLWRCRCSKAPGNSGPSDSAKSPDNTGHAADDSTDVTYCLVELKNNDKNSRPQNPEDCTIYSQVKTEATERRIPAAADALYSEISSESPLDDVAA